MRPSRRSTRGAWNARCGRRAWLCAATTGRRRTSPPCSCTRASTAQARTRRDPTRAVNAVVFATALLKHLVEFGDAGARGRARRRPPRGSAPPRSCARSWSARGGDRPETRPRSTATCFTSRARARHRRLRHGAVRRRERARDGRRRAFPRIRTRASRARRTCAETRADWVSNRASANATDALIAALASASSARRRPELGRLFAVGRRASPPPNGAAATASAARRGERRLRSPRGSRPRFRFRSRPARRTETTTRCAGPRPWRTRARVCSWSW